MAYCSCSSPVIAVASARVVRSNDPFLEQSPIASRAITTSHRRSDSGAEGIRTPDPLNAIEMRSQLRYSPIHSHYTSRSYLYAIASHHIWSGTEPPLWSWGDSNPRPHQCD
jgi:hypothetical protein